MIKLEYETKDGAKEIKGDHVEIIPGNVVGEDGNLTTAQCLFVDGQNLGDVEQFIRITVTGIYISKLSQPFRLAEEEGVERRALDLEAPDAGASRLRENYEF